MKCIVECNLKGSVEKRYFVHIQLEKMQMSELLPGTADTLNYCHSLVYNLRYPKCDGKLKCL